MHTIRIATRKSKLALWQAHFIKDQLEQTVDGLVVEIVGMSTAGDRWLDKPLSEVGGKGLFIKELEVAMLEGRADIAVHSMKDLPALLPDQFTLAAVGYRAAVHDTLVGAASLDELPAGAVIGSSSLRRASQLLAARPDLQVAPIRGNVDTRLAKLENGEYDAIVLAQAGLDRLQLQLGAHGMLPLTLSLPAAGQGALGIECVADSPAEQLVSVLNDPAVSRCVAAERGVSAGLGADCSAPLAAHAVVLPDSGSLSLSARLGVPDGSRLLSAQVSGDDPLQLAQQAVQDLMAQGAQDVLQQLAH